MWRRALALAVSNGVPRRAFLVALVVGTVLNLINQWEAAAGLAPVDLLKLCLTYLVPYCVSTYGAVSFALALQR